MIELAVLSDNQAMKIREETKNMLSSNLAKIYIDIIEINHNVSLRCIHK